jgi:hypothetical protein
MAQTISDAELAKRLRGKLEDLLSATNLFLSALPQSVFTEDVRAAYEALETERNTIRLQLATLDAMKARYTFNEEG